MRYDRIFALKDCSSYPDSGTLDMVFFLPPEKKPKRFWLMTQAESPVISIDDVQLTVQKVITEPERWLDMGVTTEISSIRGFAQLRIKGMSPRQAINSFLLVTSRVDLKISGGIEDTEEKIWGISRKDAGSTTISPAHLFVRQPALFTVSYSAGNKGLPPGSRIRFYVPRAFVQPQTKSLNQDGTVWCDNSSVNIESTEGSEESHEANDIICYLSQGLPPGGSFSLKYKTSATYIFPNSFYETDRKYWYSKIPVLTAAVAVDERKLFVSIAEENGHIVKFISGPAEWLHIFLPGRRKSGKGLKLHGVFSDKYSNVPPSGSVFANIELFLINHDRKISLGSPAGCFKDKHRFEIPLPDLKPGIYRAAALNKDLQIN